MKWVFLTMLLTAFTGGVFLREVCDFLIGVINGVRKRSTEEVSGSR